MMKCMLICCGAESSALQLTYICMLAQRFSDSIPGDTCETGDAHTLLISPVVLYTDRQDLSGAFRFL